jgi:crotonobetainyl-CoA:carnitine CoA-transferase CaiB-like acyl-CoA transferase
VKQREQHTTQQTGQGQCIDISMMESLSEWMSYPLYYAMDGAEAEIKRAYGANYSKPTKYQTKNANAQEAHEAYLSKKREVHEFCMI